jgi:hypothetical protein
MTDPLPALDLRLTPDWLKESEPGNRYADYEGDQSQDRSGRGRRDRRDERPRRPSQPTDRRRPAPNQNDRRPAAQRPAPAAQPSGPAPVQRPAETAGNRNFGNNDRGRFQRRDDAAPRPDVEPAPVQIDFLPEERAFAKIVQQIKLGHVAYPLFGLARMFLERAERHRIRVRSLDNQTMVYQFGDNGPVAMDASALERIAFAEKKEEFYETQIVEKEPIKGNFTTVARCTLSGKVLGPTNYHAFQPTIRNLYEQRFSRRMSFEDYRRTIEVSSDPAVVEQWKDEARKVVTYKTKDQDNQASFESLAAVEQHFRSHYLPALIKPCLATELSGDTARHLPDRGIIAAIRKARDRENRFPAQIAGALRHGLNHAGLQVFKHKKRILYISTVRPQLFDLTHSSVSPSLFAILSTIRSYPKISRKQLAEKVLTKQLGADGLGETNPEFQQAKTALASDLIWLAKAGHVIEFSDGSLDLPLPPKQIESAKGSAEESAEADRITEPEEETALESSGIRSESAPVEEASESFAKATGDGDTHPDSTMEESPSSDSEHFSELVPASRVGTLPSENHEQAPASIAEAEEIAEQDLGAHPSADKEVELEPAETRVG